MLRDGDNFLSLIAMPRLQKLISLFCVIFKLLAFFFKGVWLTVNNQHAFQNTVIFSFLTLVYLNFEK